MACAVRASQCDRGIQFDEWGCAPAGELPSTIGNLTNLTELDLSKNARFKQNKEGYDDYNRRLRGTGLSGA